MEKYLPEVCKIQYGFPFDSAQFSTSEGMPLIRIRDVVRGYSETFTTESYQDEYIVHQETKKPLLIDQPEDNVDNQTIYSDIKRWFMKMKHMRQVIVVTHDANIVINADADNVIIASQDKNGSFTYKYGALEYDDTLEDASLILDGGKEAVKRRLLKYGE